MADLEHTAPCAGRVSGGDLTQTAKRGNMLNPDLKLIVSLIEDTEMRYQDPSIERACEGAYTTRSGLW